MTDRPLSLDEYMREIRPYLEQQVDAQILAVPELEDRLTLMRYREQILRKYAEVIHRRNLEHRLAEAEARLRPHLVE
jgi:hypothetical protein